MAEKPKSCVYCGSHGPVTKDHVPPKSFFGDKVPQGTQLITVPCCEECRLKYEKLDERLKVLLPTMADPDENPVVRELWDDRGSIMRAARRPEAEGFRRGLLESVFPVGIQAPSGLLVGHTGGFRVGDVGIPEFIERAVRALHFHEHGTCFPGDHEVRFMGTPRMVLGTYTEEERRAITTAMKRNLRVVHRDVFKYAQVGASGAPSTAFWFVKFYNKAEFAAATGSRELLEGAEG